MREPLLFFALLLCGLVALATGTQLLVLAARREAQRMQASLDRWMKGGAK